MKNRTFDLRDKLLQFEEPQERIKCLKDSYKGETAYIVAGDPSLNNYTSEYLNGLYFFNHICFYTRIININ